MSKCELSVRLEKDPPRFLPGEAVRGEVGVVVNAPCTCNGLTLWFGWRAHGRGNRVEGPGQQTTLFRGEWMPGMDQRYPFEFRVPPGPVTYHGKLLNVDWILRARADIPWAIDPKAETDLLVGAGEGEEYDFGPRYKPPEDLYREAERSRGSRLFLFLFVAVGGAVVGFLFGFDKPVGLLIAGLSLLGGAALVLHTMWRGIAERRLGVPQVRIGTSVARGGEMIPVSVRIRPRAPVRLEGVTVELRGVEEVVSGSGTNRTTHRNAVHQARETLDPGGRELPAGEEAIFGGAVEIPADAPPTFVAPDNSLQWTITLRIGIAGWPDWKRDYPIAVRPRAGE